MAFYFLLALFPFLIVLLSLISFLPGVQETILTYLHKVMPSDAMGIGQTWFENIVHKGSGGLLSFGLLFSLWVASTGMRALMDAFNTAYDIEEGRRFWKARLVALGLTPGAVFAVASFLLASFLFSLYLQFAPSYDATYGSLGAIIVLMLWLYLLGLVLVGGELNAVIA